MLQIKKHSIDIGSIVGQNQSLKTYKCVFLWQECVKKVQISGNATTLENGHFENFFCWCAFEVVPPDGHPHKLISAVLQFDRFISPTSMFTRF